LWPCCSRGKKDTPIWRAKAGSRSPQTPPMRFVRDAEGGVLILTDLRRGLELSEEQRQTVRQARDLLFAAADVPALAWVGRDGIAAIGRVADGWIASQAARHPIVRI
jgi:hypothetical protein